MSRDKLDTDMAVPSSMDAVSEYYRKNMDNILKRSDSTETIYSTDSNDSNNKNSNAPQPNKNEISSQDRIQQALSSGDMPQSYMHDDILYKQPSNINSIVTSGSSELQIGHRFNYNGTVIIKQQIVVREDELPDNLRPPHPRKSNAVKECQGEPGNFDNIQKDDEKAKNFTCDAKCLKAFYLKHWKKFFIVFFTLSVILMSIFLIIRYAFNQHSIPDEDVEIPIISRSEWGAKEPLKKLEEFSTLVPYYIIAHTVTKECLTKDECMGQVRRIQEMHMNPSNPQFKFDDIGYNFLIGGDGNVYEGRGWDKVGAHTSSYNRLSIGIAYMGDFTNKTPSEAQLKVGMALFKKGVLISRVKEDYKIFGARQFRASESPGSAFYEIIKTWNHWAPSV